MPMLPFRALWTTEPWGVLAFDATSGFRLWRGNEWLRHRGGMRSHYDDLATSRTIMVDHLEFDSSKPPGLDYDELDRRIGRVSLAMALGLAISRDEGVDERYLSRCFTREEAGRIMAALDAFGHLIRNDPLRPSEATADVQAAIVHRTNGVVVIQ